MTLLPVNKKAQERNEPKLGDVQGKTDIPRKLGKRQIVQRVPDQPCNTCRVGNKKDQLILRLAVDNTLAPKTNISANYFFGGGGGGGITGIISLTGGVIAGPEPLTTAVVFANDMPARPSKHTVISTQRLFFISGPPKVQVLF